MSRYWVVHIHTGETWEVEAQYADDARRVVGWYVGNCRILLNRKGPFVELIAPKIAIQVKPPDPELGHVCPDCHVTMVEMLSEAYWWQCPACDLLYHEWENQYFNPEDI